MTGKDIIKNYDENTARMVKHIKYVKEQIISLKKAIPKKQKQLKEFEAEEKKLLEMTLEKWLKIHK